MNIQVKFYGPIKRAIGKDSLILDLPAGRMLGDLLEQLIAMHPEMGFKKPEEMEASYMVLAGSRIVKPDFPLTEGDEVSIFPFVDGG